MNAVPKGILIVTLAAIAGGCTVCQNARRTIIGEPRQYPWKVDRKESSAVYRAWAEESLQEYRAGCPDVAFDMDFSQGFRDGFVDYTFAGGNGEPPPVPPRRYWGLGGRMPMGDESVSRWFAGYREGASVARAGGFRQHGVVQSSYWSTTHGDVLRHGAGPGEMMAEPMLEPIPAGRAQPPQEGPAEVSDNPFLREDPLPVDGASRANSGTRQNWSVEPVAPRASREKAVQASAVPTTNARRPVERRFIRESMMGSSMAPSSFSF